MHYVTPWPQVLLSGTIGATIGVVGAVLTTSWLIRSTRRTQQRLAVEARVRQFLWDFAIHTEALVDDMSACLGRGEGDLRTPYTEWMRRCRMTEVSMSTWFPGFARKLRTERLSWDSDVPAYQSMLDRGGREEFRGHPGMPRFLEVHANLGLEALQLASRVSWPKPRKMPRDLRDYGNDIYPDNSLGARTQ
jgi:hypothetical protein